MSTRTQLRLAAREIFEEALRAVDAGAAIRNAVRIEASSLTVRSSPVELTPQRPIYSIAIGKAAVAMALALDEVLSDRLVAGIIAGPSLVSAISFDQHAGRRWRYFEGGHPLPDENSLAAARAAFALLERANEQHALVMFLISGGGSAMMEWPINDEITLDDSRAANQTLVKCGASIAEINAVRRKFSTVKGGRLAASAPDCKQVTLIVSDVPTGHERDVASGPTLAPAVNAPDAAEVVARYDLRDKLPSSILQAIDKRQSLPELPTQPDYFVLLDNDVALKTAQTAALQRGFAAEIAQDISDEQIEVGCGKLMKNLLSLSSSADRMNDAARVCLISGGEFACPVRGDGIGGRNLETALRLAIAADQAGGLREFVALCAGTDGIDGNSPAAGAIVDGTTVERARRIGLDPIDFLNRSDAYSFFVALGDAITTGPTGTNVRDVRIVLSSQ